MGADEDAPDTPSSPDVSSSAADGRWIVSFPSGVAVVDVGRLDIGWDGTGPAGKGIMGCAMGVPTACGPPEDACGCCGPGPKAGSLDGAAEVGCMHGNLRCCCEVSSPSAS